MIPKGIVFSSIALVITLCAAPASAQTRIICGFPPGGAVDALSRIFAERLAEALGRPVVVETRAGAAGVIAAVAVKSSHPDGNTLMVAPDSLITLYPHTVKKPAYDSLNDFLPVAHVGSYPFGFVISSTVPANDLKEYVAWARTSPRNASYGTAGAGTSMHFLGLVIGQETGLPLANVAYRGVGPAITDVVAGQIPAVILPLGTILPQAAGGKVRVLAQSGSKRAQAAPNIPTFKELGFPAVEAYGWFALFAPAGTPAAIVNRYNDIVVQATRTAATRERLRALDLEVREMTPAEMASQLRLEHDRWAPIVKASGFSADSQ
jgi:tripartite-type tricarboxylate transporter receptor subunit TctC